MSALKTLAASAIAIAAATPAAAQISYADEGDWTTVSGVVTSVEDDSFMMDYGNGVIEVEHDELFSDPNYEARFSPGENVTVYGEVDRDFWEGEVLDAGHIYSRSQSTLYSGDNNPTTFFFYDTYNPDAVEETWITMQGEVTDIRGRELTLTSNGAEVSVDTLDLSYNPLDNYGWQQIKEGDRITVAGTLDSSLFDETELSAEAIYVLENGENQNNKQQASASQNKSNSREATRQSRDMQGGQDNNNDQRTVSARSAEEASQYVSDDSEFAMIDTDNNGWIAEREYVNFVSQANNITKQEARKLFDAAARNDDRLTRKEFVSPSGKVESTFEQILAQN